jgi:hypothetical protein
MRSEERREARERKEQEEEREPVPECVEFREDGKHVESDSDGSNKDVVYLWTSG